MAQQVLRIDALPTAALDAAAIFHAEWRGKAESLLAASDALAIVLEPAPCDHDDWRRSAVRDLARAHAPKRVNLIVGADEAAIAATLAYLERAPGVTGQLLPVASAAQSNPAQ